jgi:hypothetical protein
MTPIQEVFLEIDWEDATTARSRRDARMVELQSQGFVCNPENLYTVDGYRVFVLVATTPEPEGIEREERPRSSDRPRSRSDRSRSSRTRV